MSDTALVIRPDTGIVRAAGDAAETLKDYREMQAALDKAMPECIQTIKGKAFRKKPYWRAIARGFNLSVECIKEELVRETFIDGLPDWGYVVTYRATAPNGAHADGDGACMATEKPAGMASLHNVRSHAHSRGFARAVSNLVGFGEVSADEMQEEPGSGDGPPPDEYHKPAATGPKVITEKQRGRLYAIAKEIQAANKWADEEFEKQLKSTIGRHGYESSKEILMSDYEQVIEAIRGLSQTKAMP